MLEFIISKVYFVIRDMEKVLFETDIKLPNLKITEENEIEIERKINLINYMFEEYYNILLEGIIEDREKFIEHFLYLLKIDEKANDCFKRVQVNN